MMKKWMSLLLALCMMMMVLPAVAETAAKENTTAETATAEAETAATETAAAEIEGIWTLYGMEEGNQFYDQETVSALLGNYTMFIKEGGTVEVLVIYSDGSNDSFDGTWETTAEGITVTMNGQAESAAMKDGMLYLAAGENAYLIFTKITEESINAMVAMDEDADLMSLLGLSSESSGILSGVLDKLSGLWNSAKESGAELVGKLSGLWGSVKEGGAELVGMLGSLLGLSDEESTTGETATEGQRAISEEDIKNFFGMMLQDLAGEAIIENTHTEFVAAESAESFYGVWRATEMILAGKTIALDKLTALGEEEVTNLITISENKVVTRVTSGKTTEETEFDVKMEFADGKLVITEEDGTVTTLRLTSDGAMVSEENIGTMIYVPVKAE